MHAQYMSNAKMAVSLQEQRWWYLNLMQGSFSGTVYPRMRQYTMMRWTLLVLRLWYSSYSTLQC